MNSPDGKGENTNFSDGVMRKWLVVFFFIGLFLLNIWAFFYSEEIEKNSNWVYIFGFFFYPIIIFIETTELVNDSRLVGVSKSIAGFIWLVFAFPLIFVGIGTAIWLLFLVFGWLAAIPAWAAVIIIILLLKR